MLTHVPVPARPRGTRLCGLRAPGWPRCPGRARPRRYAATAGPRRAPAPLTRPGPAGSNARSRRVPASSAARGRGEGAARLAGIGRCGRCAPRSPWQVPALPRQHHGAGGPRPALRALSFFWALSFFRPPLVRLQLGCIEFLLGGGKPARRFRGRRRKKGRAKGGYWGWQPRGGMAAKSPGWAEPCSARAQPPHTVLDADQASAKVLCENLTGGVAKGTGEVQMHDSRTSLIEQGNQFIVEICQAGQAWFPLGKAILTTQWFPCHWKAWIWLLGLAASLLSQGSGWGWLAYGSSCLPPSCPSWRWRCRLLSSSLRHQFQAPWSMKDNWKWSHHDICQRPQYLLVHPVRAHRLSMHTPSLLMYSLAWSSPTRGTSSLVQLFSLIFGTWIPEGWPCYWRLRHVLCHQVICLILQWAHIFFSLSFVTYVLTEAVLVVFDIPS